MWPKHYQLKKDENDHFVVYDSRDKSDFKVAKKGIHPANQIKIMKLQKFSEGGEVEEENDLLNLENNLSQFSQPIEVPGFGQQPQLADPAVMTGQVGNWLMQPAFEQPQEPVGMAPPPMMEQSPDVGVQASAPLAMTSPQVTSQSTAQSMSMPASSGGMDIGRIESQYAQGVRDEAKAMGEQNNLLAQVQDEHVKALEAQQALFTKKVQEYDVEAQKISQEIASSKIDPNRYWANQSTGSKIGAAIGVLLSGIGSGLQGGTRNMASDYIDKSIDQDIDAQKAELGKKQTLLSDNFRRFGNLVTAEQATRVQMGAIVQGKLAKVAAQTNNPVLVAQAQQKIAQIGAAMLPFKQQIAQFDVKRQMTQAALQSGNLGQLITNVVPEKLQGKAFEELGAYRKIQSGIGQVDKVLDDMSKNNTLSRMYLTDPIAARDIAKQQETRMFGIVKAIVGEKMTEGDVQNMVRPYVLGVLSGKQTKDAAARSLKDTLMSKVAGETPILTEFLGKRGVPLGSVQQGTSGGGEIKTMKGKQYRKVQGGWVPVGQ